MIAPAMAGHKPDDSTYRDLGLEKAGLARTLEDAMLPRLTRLGEIVQPVQVELKFSMQDRRPWVSGHAWTRMRLPCQWCDARLERDVDASFAALLALDEAQACAWDDEVGDEQVIVVAGERLDVPLLVEDELMLSVPTQVCMDDACVNRPRSPVDPGSDRNSPFAQMADLVRKP